MIEYDAIKAAYGDRRAERSKLPYLRHIDQGILLLNAMKVTDDVLRAWCLHPIFQLDEFYVPLMKDGGAAFDSSPKIVTLAMEYRAVANAFLTGDEASLRLPKVSPIADVNLMLIADKVQNWRDARMHLFQHVDHAERSKLDRYFKKWLDALNVSSDLQSTLGALLAEDDLWQRRSKA